MSAAFHGRVKLSEADAVPGHYYVTVKDGNRTAFLVGPFTQRHPGKDAHARALGYVRAARRYVSDNYREGRGYFMAYGTCRLPLCSNPPAGKINAVILP